MSIKYPGRNVEYVTGHKSPGFRRKFRSRNENLRIVDIELI